MDDIDDAESLAAVQAAERRFRQSPAVSGSLNGGGSAGGGGSGAAAAATAAAARDPGPTSTSTSTAPRPKVQQPTPQALPQRSLPSSILVSPRQKGNPILSHIAALPWEYTDTPADYVLGATTCALFLSLKYHRLHPEYVYGRIRGLAGRYGLRVLLVMVDIDNHEEPLRELAKTSLVNDLTLMLAWSAREAARYLEAYRSLEKADPTAIRGLSRTSTFADTVTEFVTVPRGVNRTDAVSLVGSFGSVRHAVNAERESIVAIPGWGDKKASRFLAAVNEPFRAVRAQARRGRDRPGAGTADDGQPRRIGMLKAAEVSSLVEMDRNSRDASRATPDEMEEEVEEDELAAAAAVTASAEEENNNDQTPRKRAREDAAAENGSEE